MFEQINEDIKFSKRELRKKSKNYEENFTFFMPDQFKPEFVYR